MNYRKKELKIRKIAKIYFCFICSQKSEQSYSHNPKLINFKTSVEFAYISLSAPLKQIINNDFFYQDYPGWWRLLYKKNNYERLKKNAINSFLEAFYEM